MKKKRWIVFFLFVWLWGTGVKTGAQPPLVRELPFLNQLPSKEITTLYQDKRGYIWIGTTHGLGRFDGYDLQIFRSDYLSPGKLPDNHVKYIAESEDYICIGTVNGLSLVDKETFRVVPSSDSRFLNTEIKYLFSDCSGNVWIATGELLYRCDRKLSVQKSYSLNDSGECGVVSMFQDREGEIWVLTWGHGLFRYNKEKDNFISLPRIGRSNIPFVMFQDLEGRYWIGTWGEGMYRFYPQNPRDKLYTKQKIANSDSHFDGSIFFDMTQDDSKGYLWALSYHELCAFRFSEEDVLEKIDISDLSVTGKMYSKILKDREGNLWLGAFDSGCNLIFERTGVQTYSLPEIKKKTRFESNINCINEDGEGVIWLNQERLGLTFFKKESGELGMGDHAAFSGIEVDRIVRSLHPNQMWISSSFLPLVFGAVRKGTNLYLQDTISLTDYEKRAGLVTELLEDREGNLWIATAEKLFLKPAGRKSLIVAPGNLSHVSGIVEDHKGRVWIATKRNELFQLRYAHTIQIVSRYLAKPVSGAGDKMRHLCADKENRIWIGTSLGSLFLFDPEKRGFLNKTIECGMNGDAILNLLSGGENLWIVTPGAVIRHNLAGAGNMHYTTSDENIVVSSFRNRAAYLSGDGRLYAGGHGGFISVGGKEVSARNVYVGRNEITDVCVNGKSLFFIGDRNAALEYTRSYIVLSPEDRNLEIRFSNLIYSSNKEIRYAYKLEGVDEDWVIAEKGRNSAFYNRLDKGEYRFLIRSSNESGKWNEESNALVIRRKPAWFETWYAYVFYVLLFAGAGLLLYRYSVYRMEKKNRARFQEELTRAKLEYFTNVSHELLTPLTVLSCLADDMEREKSAPVKFLDSMHNNVDRLRKLIRQVLDFRKIESGKMQLKVDCGNVSDFIDNVARSGFDGLAQKKNLNFTVRIVPEEIYGYFDADKLDRILFNLLSNAVKYTPEGKSIGLEVCVEVRTLRRFLIVKVWDEGIGIAHKELERIFTRFYTGRNGTGYESNGIGLSLTRELVQLHYGTIEVESEPGKGSCFIVSFPIDESSYVEEEHAGPFHYVPEPEEELLSESSGNLPHLLIVDDNPELLELIRRIFAGKYSVKTARNAGQALVILKNSPIDLIVCDVMMPGMDGLEFCALIKNDLTTSHIPVLMLTAKSTGDDRVDCYNVGADAYISKPFETKVLWARVTNLLSLCRQRQRKFKLEKDVNIAELEYKFADERFLNELVLCVEKHLEEPDFDLELLAAELNVSKSTMNRKIKAMLGLTPMDFVKNIKMKCACRILRNPGVTISEVSYAVGFSNPKYFAKCFKEEFGITPSQYQQSVCSDTIQD